MNKPGTEFPEIDSLLESFREHLYSDMDRADALNERAFELSQKNNYDAGAATALHNKGLVHLNKGEFPEAVSFFSRSIELKEKIRDMAGIIASNINLGIVFYHLRQFEKSLAFSTEALELARKEKYRQLEMKTLANIAMVHGETGNIETALDHYLLTLTIAGQLGETRTAALLKDNLGVLYRMKGEYEKALAYHRESLKEKKVFRDYPNIARSMGNIATVFLQQKKFREAITWFKKALKVSLDIDAKDITKMLYNNIAECYARMKKFDQAYRYKLYYDEFHESVMSDASRQQVAEIEAKYQAQKKEREIEKLRSALKEKEDIINTILKKNERVMLPESFSSLSKKEIETLSYVSRGMTDKEISAGMNVSVNTVKTFLRRVFSKLSVNNRTELVALIHRYDFSAEAGKKN